MHTLLASVTALLGFLPIVGSLATIPLQFDTRWTELLLLLKQCEGEMIYPRFFIAIFALLI